MLVPYKIVWTLIVAAILHAGSLIWFLASRDQMLRGLMLQLKRTIDMNHEEHKQIFARIEQHGQRIASVEATCRAQHGPAQ